MEKTQRSVSSGKVVEGVSRITFMTKVVTNE